MMNNPHNDVVVGSSEAKKKNTIRSVSHDLMLEILSRLPARSLVRFRCVKKQWNSLFRDPYFVSLQLKHAAKNRTTYFCHHWCLEGPQVRVYPFKVEAGELKIPYSKFTMSVRSAPQFILSNACNGLIIFYYAGLAYVVNPSTREWTSLPKMNPSGVMNLRKTPSVGLGFSKSSGKYKLVHFYYERKRWGLELLTLGVDGSWRSLGDAPCGSITNVPPTYANGFIHWTIDEGDSSSLGSILSFDVSHEKLSTRTIQLPRFHPDPCAIYRHLFTSDFEGSLSVIDWRMYFDGVQLHPVMDVHTQTEGSVWKESWRMRLSGLIPSNYKRIVYSLPSNSMFPVSLQDGKVIIHHSQRNWKLLDLHTGDSSELILPEFDGYDDYSRIRAIPFACAETIVPIDWFISPKDAA